jgi:hypothetical protein
LVPDPHDSLLPKMRRVRVVEKTEEGKRDIDSREAMPNMESEEEHLL